MEVGPKYRKIYNELKAMIDNDTLKPGDKLPSTAEMCVKYQCSATAVNTAVLLLTAEGYILGSPGLGRFVAEE